MKGTMQELMPQPTMSVPSSALDELLRAGNHAKSERAPRPQAPSAAVVVGKLEGLQPSGLPLVGFPGNPERAPVPANYTCPLSLSDVGRDAVLVFENNDFRKPILLGILRAASPPSRERDSHPIEAVVDGERVTIEAEQEIVLRCGKASITLTRAGKVLITGEYLLSRSNGVNRIKGGSVQIN